MIKVVTLHNLSPVDMYTHVIIIECDENQHKHISETCEQIRINNLFTDIAERPLVMIRFNPDSYITKKGLKVPGLFTFDTNNRIRVECKKTWQKRYR